MSRRTRRVVALVALCVAASMALGVGSYSSVSAERSVSVSVVPSEEAYLGVPSTPLSCGNGVNNVLFVNQFSAPITDGHVDVTVNGGDLLVKRGNSFREYGNGDEFTMSVDENVTPGRGYGLHLKPINDSADSIALEIEVSGSGFDVSTTSVRSVSCEMSNSDGSGSANGSGSTDHNDDSDEESD